MLIEPLEINKNATNKRREILCDIRVRNSKSDLHRESGKLGFSIYFLLRRSRLYNNIKRIKYTT